MVNCLPIFATSALRTVGLEAQQYKKDPSHPIVSSAALSVDILLHLVLSQLKGGRHEQTILMRNQRDKEFPSPFPFAESSASLSWSRGHLHIPKTIPEVRVKSPLAQV